MILAGSAGAKQIVSISCNISEENWPIVGRDRLSNAVQEEDQPQPSLARSNARHPNFTFSMPTPERYVLTLPCGGLYLLSFYKLQQLCHWGRVKCRWGLPAFTKLAIAGIIGTSLGIDAGER